MKALYLLFFSLFVYQNINAQQIKIDTITFESSSSQIKIHIKPLESLANRGHDLLVFYKFENNKNTQLNPSIIFENTREIYSIDLKLDTTKYNFFSLQSFEGISSLRNAGSAINFSIWTTGNQKQNEIKLNHKNMVYIKIIYSPIDCINSLSFESFEKHKVRDTLIKLEIYFKVEKSSTQTNNTARFKIIYKKGIEKLYTEDIIKRVNATTPVLVYSKNIHPDSIYDINVYLKCLDFPSGYESMQIYSIYKKGATNIASLRRSIRIKKKSPNCINFVLRKKNK